MTSDDPDILTITAAEDDAGARIDRYLAGNLEAPVPLSRTRLKALIQEGALSENGKVITDPSQSVRAGAAYSLAVPPVSRLCRHSAAKDPHDAG